MASWIRFRSLQQKLSLGPVAVVVGVMLVGNGTIYHSARERIRESREDLMRTFADATARQLQEELDEARTALQSWTELARDRVDEQSTDETFEDIVDNAVTLIGEGRRDHYLLLLALDAKARVRAYFGVRVPHDLPLGQLESIATGAWIERVLEGHRTGLEWGQRESLNRLVGQPQPATREDVPLQYHIAVAAPLRTDGAVSGALVAFLSWSTFQDILDRAETSFERIDLDTGYGFLLDQDASRSIGHKLRDPKESEMNVLGKRLEEFGLEALRDRIRERPAGTYSYEYPAGTKKIAAFAAVDRDNGDDHAFDWRLGVGINESDIFAPVEQLFLMVAGLSMLAALSVAMVSFSLGRRVSLSVSEMSELAKGAALGDFRFVNAPQNEDEISDLAAAFNQLLVSMRDSARFRLIPNPYVVGTPIRTKELFFGRKDDLRWIGDKLDQPGNEMILVHGPRRIGKTSLLHQIREYAATKNVVPFFFDTQQIVPELHDNQDFFHVLTREMLEQWPRVMPEMAPALVSSTERFSPEACRRLLKFIKDKTPDKVVVWLFDELENLELKFGDESLSSEITMFLGFLLESDIRISFVATGSRPLDVSSSSPWNQLTPKTMTRSIGLLTWQDGTRLIEEPLQGYVDFEPGMTDRILRTTASHPYYTQDVCLRIVDFLNLHHMSHVGGSEYEQIIGLLLRNPPPPLDYLWDSLDVISRTALAGLAWALDDVDPYATIAEIRSQLPAALQPLTRDGAKLRTALHALGEQDLLERRGETYRFRFDFLRLWLREEQKLWELVGQAHTG